MSFLLPNIFESFLGDVRKHNEHTGQISFDCPACAIDKDMAEGDGKGNLEINYHKGVYKCWACQDINGMHGSIVKLIRKYGSAKHLRDYMLVKPDSSEFFTKEDKEIIVTLPEEYKKLSECGANDYSANYALRYLRNRGITNEIIEDFEIGYASRGKYFNRIIIPSYDSYGDLNYFISRWYGKEYNKLKYLNPSAEKQEIIFNEGKINFDSTIYLVEGVMDHIVVPNSVPLLGKIVSAKLFDTLNEKAMANVVVVLDGDAKDDAKNLYASLNSFNLKNRIKVAFCPINHDPSSIYEKLGANGIKKLLMSAKRLSNT
jgi:hypothetical protein